MQSSLPCFRIVMLPSRYFFWLLYKHRTYIYTHMYSFISFWTCCIFLAAQAFSLAMQGLLVAVGPLVAEHRL